MLTGGGVNALGGYAALSAVDTFVGDNNGDGGVFTGGGIDALAPNADGDGGYAALSALPVFVGTATTDNGTATPFGPGLFTGGGVAALSNYAALSAIPAYLDDPPPAASTLAASGGGAATPGGGTTTTPSVQGLAATPGGDTTTTPSVQGLAATPGGGTTTTPSVQGLAATPGGGTTTPSGGAAPLAANLAQDPPVVEKTPDGNQTPTPTAKRNGSYSASSAPQPFVLFGSGGGKNNPDNEIRGYGDMLKKLGLNGGPPAAGAPAGGTGDPNGAAGGGTPERSLLSKSGGTRKRPPDFDIGPSPRSAAQRDRDYRSALVQKSSIHG